MLLNYKSFSAQRRLQDLNSHDEIRIEKNVQGAKGFCRKWKSKRKNDHVADNVCGSCSVF